MIYRLRVLLGAVTDCYRDVELQGHDTLEDFHNVITQSFQLPGDEMASFYTSDEDWNQGQEYSLFDMGVAGSRIMSKTELKKVFSTASTRMVYVYDFLNMWTFMVELAEIAGPVDGTIYPRVIYSVGELPDAPPAPEFEEDPRFSLDDEGDEDMDELDRDYYDDDDSNDFY